ncbi:MAG: TRAP transporter substrate-binding protein [Pirellulales bacterium]
MRRSVPVALSTVLLLLSTASCQREDAKIVRMAYASGPAELLHRSAEQFARFVAEKSNGKLHVRRYPSGQLGHERAVIEGLKLRSVDIVVTGCAIIGWYAPEYGAIEAPFAWRDYDHIEHVWNGPVGEALRETMRSRAGIELLYKWYRGPRYLTTTSRKIITPDDLKGLKLRVPELDIYIKSWQTFGANVTPLPFNDMFMALKLGVVEGQENPLATIYGNHLQEVQKYVMETQHLIGFYLVAVGPHFRTRFTNEEQQWILEAAKEATDWHNSEVEQSEADYRKKLQDAGVEFVPVDREAFRKVAIERIPQKFETTWKEGLYRRISETP